MPKAPYESLSDKGKLRRIGRLAAVTVSKEYGLENCSTGLYRFATNPLYMVRCSDDRKFILRMGYPGWRTFSDLESEAAWLLALARETDIGAPVPVANLKGRFVTPATGHGVPHTWNATLMTWIPGRLMSHYLTEDNLGKFGELFSVMHIHGASWIPPDGFTSRRFEHYLSRNEPEVLFSPEVLDAMDDSSRNILLKAREMVESEYAGLDRSDLRVIHCDLWHENVKVYHGRLRPFDFEDTVRGFRLHDIAMGMLDLLESVGRCRYEQLLPAFIRGYEKNLAWPEGSMETLQMGRMLWVLNWIARFQRKALEHSIVAHSEAFRRYMDGGGLRPPRAPD